MLDFALLVAPMAAAFAVVCAAWSIERRREQRRQIADRLRRAATIYQPYGKEK